MNYLLRQCCRDAFTIIRGRGSREQINKRRSEEREVSVDTPQIIYNELLCQYLRNGSFSEYWPQRKGVTFRPDLSAIFVYTHIEPSLRGLKEENSAILCIYCIARKWFICCTLLLKQRPERCRCPRRLLLQFANGNSAPSWQHWCSTTCVQKWRADWNVCSDNHCTEKALSINVRHSREFGFLWITVSANSKQCLCNKC